MKDHLVTVIFISILIALSCESEIDSVENFLIIPGVSVGSISLFTNRQEISDCFSSYEIRDAWVSPHRGWKYPVTSIFNNDILQMEIIWDQGTSYAGEFDERIAEEDFDGFNISCVRVYNTQYNDSNGLRIGLSLSQVVELIGEIRIFILPSSGFKGLCKNAVPDLSLIFTCADQHSIMWHKEFGSENRELAELDIYVDYMDVNMSDSLWCFSRTSYSPSAEVLSNRNPENRAYSIPRYMPVDEEAVCINSPMPPNSIQIVHQINQAGYNCSVTVWVYVMVDGTVADTYLYNICGIDSIDSAVSSAAWNSRWIPAVTNDTPLDAWTVLTYDFSDELIHDHDKD